MLNTGIVVLNDSKITPDDRAVFCVLGRPRGGTTMVSRLLEASGVFMGENMPVTAEDPDFARLLKEPNPDRKAFDDLVTTRNAEHSKWGFKAPFRNHWHLLDRLENVRFLAVFRDVLAVANRNKISAHADLLASMSANIRLEKTIVDYVSGGKRPTLLFSYEKALISPGDLGEAMLDFVGAERTDEREMRLRHIIRPNEPAYVVAQDMSNFDIALSVDVMEGNRIAGWARCSNGSSVTLVFEMDGKPVLTRRAEQPRPDLAQRFGHEGRYAFDFRLPPDSFLSEGKELIIRSAADNRPLFRRRHGG